MKKLYTSKMKSFFSSKRAGVALGFALVLTPIIGYSTASILASDSLVRFTRVKQSVITATAATSKEDFKSLSQAEVNNFTNYWLEQNFKSLNALSDVPPKVVQSSIDQSPADEGELLDDKLRFSYVPKFGIYVPLVPELLTQVYGDEGEIVAKKIYKPMELVLILDASASYSMSPDVWVPDLSNDIIETLFDGRETAADTKVSIIAYSEHINIGTKYANQLFGPKTRQIPQVGDDAAMGSEWYKIGYSWYSRALTGPKTQAKLDRQASTIRETYPMMEEDVLAEGSFSYNWARATPARRSFGAYGYDGERYAQAMELEVPDPTDLDSTGFQLILGDGRIINESGQNNSYGTPDYGKPLEKQIIMTPTTAFSYIKYAGYSKGHWVEDDVRDITAFPDAYAQALLDIKPSLIRQPGMDYSDWSSGYMDQTYPVLATSGNRVLPELSFGAPNPSIPSYSLGGWQKVITFPDDPIKYGKDAGETYEVQDSIIASYYSSPVMPALIGSSSAAEVRERLSYFNGVSTTASDEALVWTLRFLSPLWAPVWENPAYGEPYSPAPYNSDTEKIVIGYLGSDTAGYFSETVGSTFNVVTPLCKRIIDNGIKMYVLIGKSEYHSATELDALRNCTIDGQFINVSGQDDVGDQIKIIAKRKYTVQITEL